NLGRVGFLAKVEAAGLEDALDQIWRGEYGVQKRMRLEATITRTGGATERHACVNDVAIARGAQARVLHLAVDVSGTHLATYVADGVVVATPTGSTAYSFSAGGPILDPSLRNLVVTPIAAYLTAIRSVVVGAEHKITVTRLNAGDPGVVSLDGQLDVPLEEGDRVDVRALDEPLKLIEPHGSVPFYDLLRTKATLLPR
ncbi:MAG TPA: NAD(+)/NADH kinase, partial [Actinomycetota bacterium]|nr:NAD(+)/NADH kinase [Actinomycetota bacterium]